MADETTNAPVAGATTENATQQKFTFITTVTQTVPPKTNAVT